MKLESITEPGVADSNQRRRAREYVRQSWTSGKSQFGEWSCQSRERQVESWKA